MSIKTVTSETLDGAVDFDSPFHIIGTAQGGETLVERGLDTDGPEVYQFVDRDGSATGEPDVSRTDWEPVTGYSGQHGYSGPVMHTSEFLGCRMAEDVLEDAGGIYCLTVVECLPEWGATDEERDEVRGSEPAGWMLLRYIGA